MAGGFTDFQQSYKIMDADGVKQYRGVTRGANEGECKKPTAINAIPLGVVVNDERVADGRSADGDQTGKQVAVLIDGIALITVKGAVAYGDRVVLDTGGFAIKIPVTAGQYNVLGFVEKAGVDGDVIPVLMDYHVFTV